LTWSFLLQESMGLSIDAVQISNRKFIKFYVIQAIRRPDPFCFGVLPHRSMDI
jgi:hypothetical protein